MSHHHSIGEKVSLPGQLLPAGISAAWLKSNLAFALLCLPGAVRRDMMIFYQFCRILDDLADETTVPFEIREAFLDLWKEGILGKLPLPSDLAGVITKHQVPRQLLLEIHAGVTRDLRPAPFATRECLQKYCSQVAVAVGLASNLITGCKSPDSNNYAENLGMALQLTNILRDVREDAAVGRVYFCAEDLEACGVNREDILAGAPGPNFPKLWQLQAGRARKYFDAVACGPPAQDRRALAAAEIMRKLYGQLLVKMETDGARVWEKRYRLSWLEKLRALIRQH
jgi:phytoene synthase